MRASATSSTDVLFADNVVCEKRKRFLVTFCRLAKSYPLLGAEAFALKKTLDSSFRWNDELKAKALDSSFRWNDEQGQSNSWIPAFAGMTILDVSRAMHQPATAPHP
jgi:hypothetical protein